MPRHLLVINHFATTAGAPGGTRHAELAERLDGWRTTVLTGDHNYLTRRPAPAGPPSGGQVAFRSVRTLQRGADGPATRLLSWASFACSATAAALRGPRPDLVLASSPQLLAGLAGWAVAAVRRVPFVLEVRDLWPRVLVDMGQVSAGSPAYRALRWVERFLYARADAVVVLAAGVRDALVSAEGLPADRVVLIPNGADPARFAVEEDRGALRERFGLTGYAVVYAGAHGVANGLDLVLDAAAALADRPEVRFVLVGDGACKSALVAAAASRGLANVEFRDPVPGADVPALLAGADLGLHVLADVPLFRYGVSPNKVVDYLAAGLPVVTNSPGEVGDLVTAAGAGLVAAPDGLADAVRAAYDAGPELWVDWGRAGRAYLGEHLSRAVLAGRLQALLDRLAPPPPPPPPPAGSAGEVPAAFRAAAVRPGGPSAARGRPDRGPGRRR